MTKISLPKAGRAAATIGAAALMGFAGPTTVQAEQNIPSQIEHFVDCFGWMITDPETQVANCTPNRVVVPFGSLTSPVTNPPVSTPPVIVDPCVLDPEACVA